MEKLVIKILLTILPLISPEIKEEMHRGIAALKEKASKTPNKFDDILVSFLESLLAP